MCKARAMRVHFTGRNLRRVFVLLLFVGSLVLLRHLGLLFVFFVLFERGIGFLAGLLNRRARADRG